MAAEDILQPWFNTSIQPAKSMLWVSAVAPETVQGNPNFLKKLLERPLEKPDAMGRRKACARYGTCLIAQALAELNPEPSTLSSLLTNLDFLRRPDTLLMRPLPNPVQEGVIRLIQAGYDPTPTWDKQLRKATQIFQRALEKISEILKVPPPASPRICSYFAEEESWWGVNQHPLERVINILPPFILLHPIRLGLLLREAVRINLPISFHTALDAQEFANSLATHLLPKHRRQLWNILRWGGTPPTPAQMKGLAQVPLIVTNLIRTQRLPTLLKRLKSIDQIAGNIVTGGLTTFSMMELETDSKPIPFTKTHQQVLLAIAQNPSMSERQLAQYTKLARGTIRRSLAYFRKSLCLTVGSEINYNQVKLTPLLLFISKEPHKPGLPISTLAVRLESFPYCIRLFTPIASADSTLFAFLILPTEMVPQFWTQITQILKAPLYKIWLSNINRFEWGWHFRWWQEFNADEWQVLAQSQLRPYSGKEGYLNEVIYQGPLEKLTKQALRVLIALEDNYQLSIRALAKKTRISVTTAWNYQKHFTKTLLTPHVQMKTPNLREILALTIHTSNLSQIKHLSSIFQILPAFQQWHLLPPTNLPHQKTQIPSLLSLVALPRGGIISLTAALEKVLSGLESRLINPPYFAWSLSQKIRELPVALYDSRKQNWLSPLKLLSQLIE